MLCFVRHSLRVLQNTIVGTELDVILLPNAMLFVRVPKYYLPSSDSLSME